MDIAPAKLAEYAAAILVATGSSAAEAREVAEHLVEANLKGHDSHGVGMLREYVANVKDGHLHPNKHARLVSEFGAIAVFDGDMGYGQVIAREATEWGIAKATSTGLAAVAVRNTHHVARVGTYGELAADAGLVSLHFVNVLRPPGRVAPYGGIDGRYGTDPICITFPSFAGEPPVVLDFATSKVAAGKIRVAFLEGKELDPGTLLDGSGNESRDPGLVYGPRQTDAAILPFGEHKGSGLALLAHLLSGVLSGGGVIHAGLPFTGVQNSMLSIYLDPARFGDLAEMERNRALLIDWVKSARPRPGFDDVLIAGEPERNSKRSRSEKIPVDDGTWEDLKKAAAQAGISWGGDS